MNYTTAQEAAKLIKSGDRIYLHAVACTPNHLIDAIVARASELRNVEFCHIHTLGNAPYADPKYKESFFVNSFFVGGNVRHTIREGNGTYTPVFLSELPSLFDNGLVPLDVALIQVSTPDENGYCSLGPSVVAAAAAIRSAKLVIAQVNNYMPKTFGDAVLHISQIDVLVEHHTPLLTEYSAEFGEVEDKIGGYIAEMIEDSSTLQMGIGSIPEAVLQRLKNHKHLGLHTEMFADGVIDLIEAGALDCSQQTISNGKAISTFLIGTERLYKYVDNNPFFELRECSYTNDPFIIQQNPKMIAINSAVEIDVTGQICADSIGANIYSGVGGQVDFMRGATRSQGGKAIIAMSATTKKGGNKIVPFLKKGAGVVTSRAHAQYIVTEYGVADLRGKSIVDRVHALANIAHPDFREDILREYFDNTRNK
ncbi:acetyl-CoA hydrolase/transferase family protein [Myroides marinus]|uniref:acetyl-CoA hydrolase/transferase family protein n=1 Tax=Myroides marinus TaxID=703342 RepID=UPI0025782A74|nr:acetyl-CoA hydrolase/transferase C-terminal domain-containing protein [Myroides marinus]MDM1346937.1 acetyl-CoA hydrolase/transferase family protein [Myroides marinus]MDM1350379.1 acetyl-CoA hydrolase/transferase family protein [Myroides marinus]MDM1354179.1 acetyl-CoA hydrolase/transferase family protein [Myroides marinus]MDM1357586.1 acetyl-CoA hydrolase/transferase family protein [Myroides marinus]MDM1361600.1 acetyl-CoA hydrolase/transferase family protein [Myroides marinus]